MFKSISDSELAQVQGGNAFKAGKHFGFDAGVLVTKGLKYVPGENAQVPGAPAGFQKRHIPVVGKQLTGIANHLPNGAVKNWFTGAGIGANAAPTWTYRQGE